MLLVLGAVAGDRLVAELGELDPHLLGGDAVGAVADDRPVPTRRRQAAGPPTAMSARRAKVRSMAAGRSRSPSSRAPRSGGGDTDGVGDGGGEQEARRDLGVEGLGGRHAHLHVAAVGGVEHPVGPVGEIAVATVDDGDHVAAAGPHQVDGAVGVGGGARLADGHDQRVGHRVRQLEAGQLGGQERPRPAGRVPGAKAVEALGEARAATAAVPWPMATTRSIGAVGAARPAPPASRTSSPSRTVEPVGTVDELAPQRLAERRRGLADLLQEEVRAVAPVDVAGGDLGGGELVALDGERGAVVRPPLEARRSSRRRRRGAPSPGRGWPGWPDRRGRRRRGGGTCRSPRPRRRARWPR